MDRFPVLDESVLTALLKFGQPEFVAKMIELFLNCTGTQVDAMETGAANSDWAAVAFASHSLKSSSGNLGLPQLSDLLQRIEVASRKGLAPEAAQLATQVRALWDTSCQALVDYRERLGA